MTGAEDTDPGTIEHPNLPLGRPGHARQVASWVAFLGGGGLRDGGLVRRGRRPHAHGHAAL